MFDDLIGIPFVPHGRTLQGLDCYGLVKVVFKKYGMELQEYDYDLKDVAKLTDIINNAFQSSCWERVDSLCNIPLLMTLRMGVRHGFINHTAVYIGNGKFIHTREHTGVCIESIYNPSWKKRIEGFYRYGKTGTSKKSV